MTIIVPCEKWSFKNVTGACRIRPAGFGQEKSQSRNTDFGFSEGGLFIVLVIVDFFEVCIDDAVIGRSAVLLSLLGLGRGLLIHLD